MYTGSGKEWEIKEDDLEVTQEVKWLVGKIVQLMRTDYTKDRLGMIGVSWKWKGCNNLTWGWCRRGWDCNGTVDWLIRFASGLFR